MLCVDGDGSRRIRGGRICLGGGALCGWLVVLVGGWQVDWVVVGQREMKCKGEGYTFVDIQDLTAQRGIGGWSCHFDVEDVDVGDSRSTCTSSDVE